jgi:hypothetical protein
VKSVRSYSFIDSTNRPIIRATLLELLRHHQQQQCNRIRETILWSF